MSIYISTEFIFLNKHIVFTIVQLIDWLIPEVSFKIKEQIGREKMVVQHALWEKMREDNVETTKGAITFYDIDEFSDDDDDNDEDERDNKEKNDSDNNVYENQTNNFEND